MAINRTSARKAQRCLWLYVCGLLACTALLLGNSLSAQEAVPKEVTLIVNGKRLVASNVRLSRFDELDLNAQERIAKKAESKGVLIVITNQRFIGYGVSSGWRDIKTEAGERLQKLQVEDYAAFVTTDRRYLNFNGQTGVWARQEKGTNR